MDGAERQERRQRVRIGLTGLAFVFLLVLLGTAISRSGEDPAGAVRNSINMIDEEPDDPLAQIGAAPGAAKGDNAAVAVEPTETETTAE